VEKTPGRSGLIIVGILLGIALALGTFQFLRTRRAAGERLPSAGRADVRPAATGPSQPEEAPTVASPLARSAAEPGRAPETPIRTQAQPPDEGLDGPAWKSSKLAFGMRELGKMGPYVKVGLDAARRDMEFCFRETAERASSPDAPALPPDPGVLLLYLDAREGAIDVIDARMEHPGTSTPALVECCREVLRGFEIPAFGAVPGERYRVRFALE
jgi:hypothetical protein